MSEHIKFIVNEINNYLKTNYNLISFDSLSNEGLLQVLVDSFAYFEAVPKFDVRELELEMTTNRIMECLRKIQYQPEVVVNEIGTLEDNITAVNKKVIYHILHYIYSNVKKIRQLVYLAKYLLPLQLPMDAMANVDIANLWNEYQAVMTEFKEVHQAYTTLHQENDKYRELRSDVNAIESEKENVKHRMEKIQVRLDKLPQQELLLEAANALRTEQDRQKDLQAQLDEQRAALNRSNNVCERLKKEIKFISSSSENVTPDQLLSSIIEESEVLEFMIKQKLPNEVASKRSELQLYEEVINEPSISTDYLNKIQSSIDGLTREVQQLMEQNIARAGNKNDELQPFRQQAAAVARNKDLAAEQLNQVVKELHDTELQLQQKQQILHQTVGEVVLRGDDLKQYVNTLRAKSSLYKQQRAELAAIKADVADLSQTLDNLKSQDPTLNTQLNNISENNESSDVDELLEVNDRQEITELNRVVEGLARAVTNRREKISPLCQRLRLLKSRIEELKDDKDSKKQAYDSLHATLVAEQSSLQNNIAEIEKRIKSSEARWQELKASTERYELLLEKAREDNQDEGSVPLRELLAQQINEQEDQISTLQKEQQELINKRNYKEKQCEMWANVCRLMKIKLDCANEAKHREPDGTLLIEKGAETFTLN